MSSSTSMPSADEVIASLQARACEHRVAYQGMGVHWRSWGEGPPLVLLHGGHGSWLHWVRNIDVLAARHTLWVPDMPGFGDSDSPRARGDFKLLREAVAATLDLLVGAGGPVDLAGFSFGGLVAAELAAMRGNVRRLALLGPAGHGGARRQTQAMTNWRLVTSPAALEDAFRQNLASLMLFEPERIDALALQVQALSNQATRFRSKPISRAAGLPAALARIQVPTLLLWGEHDVTGDPSVLSTALQAGRPERQSSILPGVGHWVQYEAADDCSRLLADWFASP